MGVIWGEYLTLGRGFREAELRRRLVLHSGSGEVSVRHWGETGCGLGSRGRINAASIFSGSLEAAAPDSRSRRSRHLRIAVHAPPRTRRILLPFSPLRRRDKSYDTRVQFNGSAVGESRRDDRRAESEAVHSAEERAKIESPRSCPHTRRPQSSFTHRTPDEAYFTNRIPLPLPAAA